MVLGQKHGTNYLPYTFCLVYTGEVLGILQCLDIGICNEK